jgi:hypothetical protein
MAYDPASGYESLPETDTPDRERRRGDRRRSFGRRDWDREFVVRARTRTALAAVGAMAGGLAVLYMFFAAIGAVDLGDAVIATIAALVLGGIWLAFFIYRIRTNALRVQRPDRERRGF